MTCAIKDTTFKNKRSQPLGDPGRRALPDAQRSRPPGAVPDARRSRPPGGALPGPPARRRRRCTAIGCSVAWSVGPLLRRSVGRLRSVRSVGWSVGRALVRKLGALCRESVALHFSTTRPICNNTRLICKPPRN